MKLHPVTGEEVPDDSARVPLERLHQSAKAEWPAADFVVGNPPFIGDGDAAALGDGYVEALRGAWPDVPESADFVMYWWHHAATLAQPATQRFGLITTNSLRQTFNRRVVDSAPGRERKSSMPLERLIPFADDSFIAGLRYPTIPVDSADGAAVRIAMTRGRRGTSIRVDLMTGGMRSEAATEANQQVRVGTAIG